MFLDLELDFHIRMPCGCVVAFIGGGRNHRLTKFDAGHPVKGTTVDEEPSAKKRLANHDKHREACVSFAKRWRCTKMERIEEDEPETGEPIPGE